VAAIGAASGSIGGYDAKSAVTFAWLPQALIAPVYLFTWTDLSLRVRTGDIAIDLAPADRPTAVLAGHRPGPGRDRLDAGPGGPGRGRRAGRRRDLLGAVRRCRGRAVLADR